MLAVSGLLPGLSASAPENTQKLETLRVPACTFNGCTLAAVTPAKISAIADRIKSGENCSIASDRPCILAMHTAGSTAFRRMIAGEKFNIYNPALARCLILSDRLPAEITIYIGKESYTVPLASATTAAGDDLPGAYTGALFAHMSSASFVPANGELYYRLSVLRNRHGKGKDIQVEQRWRRRSRSEMVELFELTSGTLAMEQSLQLNAGRDVTTGKTAEAQTVPVKSLEAPKLKTHDFAALMKNRKAAVPVAARMVPHDALFLRFDSIAAALRADDLSNALRNHVPLFTRHVAPPDDLMVKVLTHLALKKPNPITRKFYGLAIGELSVILEDPYVIEGADMAFLIEVKSDSLFDRQIRSYRDDFRNRFPGTVESSSTYGGISITRFASPGGEVRAHAFRHGKFAVIATSMPFARRIIDAIQGRERSAADNPDYRYLLALHGSGGDAFVYVGDDFVARIVSAPFKIAELRRVNCEANMNLMRWAVNYRLIEKGSAAPPDGLVKEGYLSRMPACPCGGEYSMEGGTPRCSKHGRLGQLLPLSANEVVNASESEAGQYRRFVENYHRYWRTYIDPIGITARIGNNVSLHTVILPLVENREYDLANAVAGGSPVRLQALSMAPGNTVFHLAAKLRLFDGYRADLSHVDNPTVKREMAHVRENLKRDYPDFKGDFLGWIGNEFDIFFTDFGRKEDANAIDPRRFDIEREGIRTIMGRLSVSDHALAGELFRKVLPRLLKEGALSEDAKLGGPLFTFRVSRFPACLLLRKDGLWASGSVDALREKVAQSGGMFKKSMRSRFGLGDTKGNFEAGIYPSNMKNSRPLVARMIHMLYAERCEGEMRRYDAAVLLTDPVSLFRGTAIDARRLFPGTDPPTCPLGGTYRYENGAITCSIHQAGWSSSQFKLMTSSTPLETVAFKVKHFFTRLGFTPEGIDTEVIFKNPAD